MKTRRCPRCQHHTLVQTSVFWSCDACQLAITTVALSIETHQAKSDCRDKMARSSA
jgi:ribosomal protein L37AE/L43A